MYNVNVNSANLSYNARFKRFVGEISTISRTKIPTHITIDSHRTGRSARFWCAYVTRAHNQGEPLYWTYSIEADSARVHGLSPGTTIVVFND